MGLLVDGKPLSWEATELLAEHIWSHGITQFLKIWDRTKGRVCHEFLWGDEIEYMVAALDDKNAAINKFAFRKDIFPPKGSLDSESTADIQEMSLDKIINGDGGAFPGLMGAVEGYLRIVGADEDAMDGISKYLELIKLRAKGGLCERFAHSGHLDLITSRPAYKQDSIVSDEMNYHLIKNHP
ncbi:hypothetical protein L198_05408 [Cryptococcus wingfieldii CBS 7118]|uniref:Glutamate--cysteine ligase n=1 Tax=Cryptococcus wingfieldii CBS 7118 TaxID=1295528 RepID=A0A1E3IY30_9TREE|nr:hypothetical protein L198_05408 [Cryptococcus wingfieldii CBS 7118]ODN93543.1 hypothetical protein L198_05408 [Cryptococcus wingfieldii CBS 7118]